MMVLCIGIVVVGYDRRRSGLSNTPLAIECDISSLEQYSSKHQHQHQSSSRTVVKNAHTSLVQKRSLACVGVEIRRILRERILLGSILIAQCRHFQHPGNIIIMSK